MEPKIYVVERIDGDYAHLVEESTGDTVLIARALLPEQIDEGSRLRYEYFCYECLD